jgi:outer membrane protein assembly factor BamB
MPDTTIDNLRNALGLGLSVVSRVWDYKVRDWVTSVSAADINNDGEAEVVICSRDGRILLLTVDKGDRKWERVVVTKEEKTWVGTGVAVGFSKDWREASSKPCIIVGTRKGKIYCYDKDGQTITKDGKPLPYNKEGEAFDKEKEKEAFWYNAGNVIRQVVITSEDATIIIASEDRNAYGIDFKTGELRWKFQTNGWVRAICVSDINNDGIAELIIGSTDKFLYVLDTTGCLLAKYCMEFPIHNIVAEDVDRDGFTEILVSTDGRDLTALTYNSDRSFIEKWRHPMPHRFLSLCVADIDGDGQIEIIGGSEDKHIYFLDSQGSIIWRHQQPYRAYSLFPIDVDKDGFPELLVGSDDNSVRAMRIRLRGGLDKNIRKYYRQLGEPDPSSLKELSSAECNVLRDILNKGDVQYVTLKQAETLISARKYLQALSTLLRLKQQRVQQLWYKEKIGHIRTISFRHKLGISRREIIVGTSDGHVLAYNPTGSRQWFTQLEDPIIDVQTGFIERNVQEEIVICSSDHHVYVLIGARKRDRRKAYIETRLSSVSVAASNSFSPAEIFIGSEEKKLYIYGSDLEAPTATINTHAGIRVVRTHASNGDHKPEIFAGCLDNYVYAYTRRGGFLWKYPTHDHIRSICLKDINADGKIEVIVGSEDRNVHVLDSEGHLLWRYFLPHSVLSVDAADADHDGIVEIFVGCADGYLYVFNREGDLLWKYQAHDRIHAVRVEDIDDDGMVEIALGSEDDLELLQVVNQRSIQDLIDRCWSALCKVQPEGQVINDLLQNAEPLLQSFALDKFAGQESFSVSNFATLEQFVKESSVEIRQALIQIVMEHYQVAPVRAYKLLLVLSGDQEQDVRNTYLQCLPDLIKYDWDNGLLYLSNSLESENRFVRRLVVRTLHQIVNTSTEITKDHQHKIFNLLLAAALDKRSASDKGSDWVRREAARTLAGFLDCYPGRLIVDVHLLLVHEVQPEIVQHIAYTASQSAVKSYLNTVIPLLIDLNEDNVLMRTQQMVNALESASGLDYSSDLGMIYAELCNLLSIDTINGIAQYQCSLSESQFAPKNVFARIMLDAFGKLNSISSALRNYLRREGLPDRLSSLLDADAAIGKTIKDLDQLYSLPLMGTPITKLPNHRVFNLLLLRWRKIILAQLNELRGKAEFIAELHAKHAPLEDLVGVWLVAQNIGQGTANNVKITLLHNDNFPVVGKKIFTYDNILPQEKVNLEFIVKPKISTLDLRFAIMYEDAESAAKEKESVNGKEGKKEKEQKFVDRLELSESRHEFLFIPNPYSTGAPTHDRRMFFGREEDMAYLRDNLTRDAKTVMVLYGQRRAGKTTLLFQLMSSDILGVHVPVLIDMQGLALNINIHNFLYRIAYTIAQTMKKKGLQACDPVKADFETEPTHAFDVFLENAEQYLGERKLVLMVDEFEVLEEQVFKGKLEYEVFPYLRNMLQHHENINLLFAGTHKITEHTKLYGSAFFNIARHYQLTRLSRSGAEALIQKPVEGYLEYEPSTIEKILILTNNQPYLIHLLCRAIVDYCNDNRKTYVTINDVNLLLQEVMQTIHFHFDWLWNQITPEERVTLSALAEGGREDGRWLTLDEIIELYQRANIRFKRERLLDSLRSLIDADIIESESSDVRDTVLDSSRFRIPVGLTSRWLLRDKPFDLIRDMEMGG